MNNILQHLYHGNLNESERKAIDLHETEEYKKYIEHCDTLIATFSKEQEKLFHTYFEWESAYRGIENEKLYANGFKTGMCIALELLDFKPPWWEK